MSEGAKQQRRQLRQQRLETFLLQLEQEGITQREVATRANIPPQYLNDVKAGRRPLGELFARRLHEKLGVDYLWLLAKTDHPEESSSGSLQATGIPFTVLPMFAHPIEGDPRGHPKWKGSVIELAGVAAARALKCRHPYVLRFGAKDRRGRLRKNDLLLVSQGSGRSEIRVIRLDRSHYLALGSRDGLGTRCTRRHDRG